MTTGLRRHAPLLLIAVLALAPGAAANDPEPSRAWRWLPDAAPEKGLYLSPLLDPVERASAKTLSPSVLALALTGPRERPETSPIVGAGAILRSDGLVATSWQVLSQVSRARWLWARTARGRWMRAIPMGSTWWGDVGLCRLVTPRRRFATVRRAGVTKKEIRRSYLVLGAGSGRGLVASVGRLTSLVLFDPEASGGRRTVDRSWRKSPSETTPLIGLHFEDAAATGGSTGSPVFDPETGVCVGLVSATAVKVGRETRVLVRPWSYLEPFLANILLEAQFNPPDLGFRWGPVPRRHGVSPGVPADLESAREHEPGGLLVRSVLPAGPANRILWEGDVVLEIEGRPVFGEVYESVALALMRLHPGVPTDLVLLRGGKRRPVQVGTHRARDLHDEYDAEHASEAGLLPRVR